MEKLKFVHVLMSGIDKALYQQKIILVNCMREWHGFTVYEVKTNLNRPTSSTHKSTFTYEFHQPRTNFAVLNCKNFRIHQ
jgi:hypothetical protein